MAPGYESVRRMFEDNFKSGSEENSQLCVYVQGEVVVDLWGSKAGALADTQHPFTADTVTNVFSSTKSLTAICIAMLVDRGGTIGGGWYQVLAMQLFSLRLLVCHTVYSSTNLFSILNHLNIPTYSRTHPRYLLLSLE